MSNHDSRPSAPHTDRPSATYHISAYEQTAARYGTQPDIDIVRPPKTQEP